MEFSFHVYNSLAETGIALALRRLLKEWEAPPAILCIGSDLAIGDSLGPIVGTLLRQRMNNSNCYIYGTLRSPITAKEVKYVGDFLRNTHPRSKIIAIDAAVGEESEIGLIKVNDTALRPGSGANKRLGRVGDISVLGILAKKTNFSFTQLNLTRLNTVYTMANTVAEALYSLFGGGAGAKSRLNA